MTRVSRSSARVAVVGLLAAGLLATAGAAAAQVGTAAEPLRLPRVAQPPTLEEFVSGPPRADHVEVTGFRQFSPGDGDPVSLETRAYLSYDDRNLYVIFVCKDDPANIRARLAKREDIFGDEGVEIFLDTFHDRQRSYVFAANPYGIQLDSIFTEGQGYEFSFDTLWHSRGQITADGFVVWMAIPFKSLRFVKAPVQTWGISLARIVPRNNEFAYWPYVTERVEGFVQQFATMEWREPISPGRNIQLIPYAATSGVRLLEERSVEEGFGYDTDLEARAGLDAKLILRDALALDLTFNPDFSQVESDEPQVVINRRFEVFFPEKRPFFLENAGFFTTPVNLFFSRRILDPDLGGRLTGKLGRWALGGLVMDDRGPGELAPVGDPAHDKRAAIGVVRAQREFGEQSYVGLLASDRELGSTRNRVLSLDSRLTVGENWALTAQAVTTRSDDGFGELDGDGYFGKVERGGRHFTYSGSYLDLDDEFRADLGFVPRVGIRQTRHTAAYQWRPNRETLVAYGPNLDVQRTWDQKGELQDWFTDGWFNVDLTSLTSLRLGRTEYFERYLGHEFRYYGDYLGWSSEWFSALRGSGTFYRGTAINYFPAPGVEPFLADHVEGRLSLSWIPMSQLRIDPTYIYTRLRAQRDELPVATGDRTVFTNHLLRTKLNYQFNVRLSGRLILDYRALEPNPDLVVFEHDERWTGDILFAYVVNPGTALYVGYTENRENLALTPGLPHGLVRTDSPEITTGRQVVIKLSYLLRY